MCTQNQLDANRRNAQLSTGPITLEGKKKVRFNAYKHGFYAQAAIIKEWEDPEAYQVLHDGYFDDYQPVGVVEQELTARAVLAIWEIRRLTRAERQFYEHQLPETMECVHFDPEVSDGSAMGRLWRFENVPHKAMVGPESIFEVISRCKTRSQRNYDRAIEALNRHQKARLAKPARPSEVFPIESNAESEPEPPIPLPATPPTGDNAPETAEIAPVNDTNQKPNPEIGFVSQIADPTIAPSYPGDLNSDGSRVKDAA
jgi:hypothetical protein